MTTPAEEDEFSELVDADFSRVDLVGKGANGVPRFLIAKQDGAAGLLDAGYVRDLIAKAEPASEETVTMTGSPAAIAKLVHGAPVRGDDVAKAKNDAADRRKKAASGAAMPDGSYPIADESDLHKAIRAVGRGGSSHNAIRRHIISRARSLGASSAIPDNWNSDGSIKETVSKADLGPDLDDGVDGLDPTIPLAAPEDEAPGDPTDPGSPAWEAIDAATASKWASILARAKVAIGVMAEREMLEAASADPADAENAFDLEDACCAIDYAISVLAPFAVGEQSEADCGAAEMEAIGKAMAVFDAGPLEAVEGLTTVAKAGRVLSAVNENRIREAAASLQSVLQTLPAAPVADEPVSKEATVPASPTEAQTAPGAESVVKADADDQATGPVKAGGTTGLGEPRDAPQEPLPGDVPGRQVIKADGDGEGKAKMVAVFDSKGDLVGVCDPGDITPIAGADAPAANEEEPAAEPQPGPAAAAAADGDMTPEPPAAAGVPSEGVAKSDDTETTDEREVLKSIVADAVTAALDARGPAEDIAKQADVAGLTAQIEVLKAAITALEEQPAMPKVFTNGAVPPPGTLRGQDHGSQPVDVAKARELKNTLYRGTAPEQNEAAREMQEAAIARLAQIHSAPRG